MRKTSRIFRAACWCLFAVAAAAQESTNGDNWEGLISVTPKRIDALALMPGADFRPYRKLMLESATIAFRKDWMTRNNRSPLAERVTQQEAEEIAAAMRENFTEVFTEVFRKAGYEIVAAPGADVLQVRAGIVDLYLAAPDSRQSGRGRTFTLEAGEATLFLEARDSTSGALLGRGLDRRTTRNTGRLMIANRATNRAEFRLLFQQWADIVVAGLANLREISPVPADLKPGQKLVP
jgi:hypothetical protein